MIKRQKYFFIALILLMCAIFSFAGCNKSGPIPNGYYIPNEGNFIYHKESDWLDKTCWEIDGDLAQSWTSSQVYYKAKIVVENDKIYFNGFKWKDFPTFREEGSTMKFEVIYDEQSKTITLEIIRDV